jgi:protein-disulfide isomerase
LSPKSNTRRTLLLGALGTAAAAATLGLPAFEAQAQTVSGLFDDLPIADNVMGDVNAPVTIVEYASMTCPHCRTFHENVLPVLKEEYIDTGKVKLILRPFPFDGDRRGEAAFMLAKCAPNGNYYPMVDALFQTQSNWSRADNPVPELQRIAALAGMDEPAFRACLGNQELLASIIAGRNKAVSEFGVKATPTIFVNNQKLGDSSLSTLREAIDAAL